MRTAADCWDFRLYENLLFQLTEPRMILIHDFQSTVYNCIAPSDGIRTVRR